MKKKLLTLALAAVMVVSSAVTAMADTKESVTSKGPWADSTGEETLTGDFDVTYTFHTATTYPDADTALEKLNKNFDTFGFEVRNADAKADGFTIRADYFGWGFGTWEEIGMDTWKTWSCTDNDALKPGENNQIDWTDWCKTFMSADVTINVKRVADLLTIKMKVEGDNDITYDITAPITIPVKDVEKLTLNLVVPSAGETDAGSAKLVSTVKFTEVKYVDNNAVVTPPAGENPPAGGNGGNGGNGAPDTADMAPVVAVVALAAVAAVVVLKKRNVTE